MVVRNHRYKMYTKENTNDLANYSLILQLLIKHGDNLTDKEFEQVWDYFKEQTNKNMLTTKEKSTTNKAQHSMQIQAHFLSKRLL